VDRAGVPTVGSTLSELSARSLSRASRSSGATPTYSLTLKEIQHLACSPRGADRPHLARALERVERRIEKRLAELQSTQQRIEAFRSENAAALAGAARSELVLDA